MGKPYQDELQQLPETYVTALSEDISPLLNGLAHCLEIPLLTVGSGGSFSVANFTSFLHQYFTGKLAKAITPLEAVEGDVNPSYGYLCFSAVGRNMDILRAFRLLACREPATLLAMVASRDSRLAELKHQYLYTSLFEYDLPCGRDGFLATNSLFSMSVMITRAYLELFNSDTVLPQGFDGLLGTNVTTFVERVRQECECLFNKDTIIVLYSITCKSAAIDLESKFAEAALGNIQLADFRNFGHGRHHWLAKHQDNTAVLALVSDKDEDICERTLSYVPEDVPVFRLHFRGDPILAGLSALVSGLYLVGEAGKRKGIDPGRPGVPAFGSKLYRLGLGRAFRPMKNTRTSRKIRAIERKAGKTFNQLREKGDSEYWERSYRTFRSKLRRTTFQGIVFDYDGTLCEPEKRYSGLDERVGAELLRVLQHGICVGLATGRGKSVLEVLRNGLPKTVWSRVAVGYYNGSIIRLLSDGPPDSSSEYDVDLVAVAQQFEKVMFSNLEIELRKFQLSVVPRHTENMESVWRDVKHFLLTLNLGKLEVLRSSHSIDILAPNVSKLNVIRFIEDMVGNRKAPVLCVGDMGLWPGNDYELLAHPYSLSVHEVSSAPNSCWNLASAGQRGVSATLEYLESFVMVKKGAFKVDL